MLNQRIIGKNVIFFENRLKIISTTTIPHLFGTGIKRPITLSLTLEKEFDDLFSTEPGYPELDERIEKIGNKKKELLMVLKYPEIPLHNNGSENGARIQKRREDVSLQTKSENGTAAKDAMMSNIETCRKLGVKNFIIAILCVFSFLCFGEERDPWLWPFSQDSIWNMPIGSKADYQPANLPAPRHVGCDIEWHLKTTKDDPIVPVYSPSSWKKRWPGKKKLGELRIPAKLIIPDANPPHTPNACAVFLMPDGRTIRQLEPTCRPVLEKRIVGWLHGEDQDLYGKGIKGTHYGSGLSSLGGSIRKGELISKKPLRHALKINLWAKYLFYSEKLKGFRWPADRADSYAAKGYKGSNPKLVMGSLLALPPTVTPEQLKIKTEVGRKIFDALQNYGAYISDDSAWDASDLCVERGVPEEVKKKYGYSMIGKKGPFIDELKRMIKALHIVDNNSPNNVGGGGTLRAPLAPPLKKKS